MIKRQWHRNFMKTGLIMAALAYCFISSSCIVTPDDGTDDTEQTDSNNEDNNSSGDSSDSSTDDSDENESSSEDSGSSSDTTEDTSDSESAADSVVLYVNLSSGKWSADNSSFTQITTTKKAAITDVSIKYKTDDDDASTGLILIDAEDATETISYYLTGTMTTGGVKIKTNSSLSNAAKVYLNSVEIDSSNYPCLAIMGGGAATVYLNGTNTFKDGRSYGTGYGEEYSTSSSDTYKDDDGNTVSCTVSKTVVEEGSDSKGTLFCKGNLTLEGSGSLTLTTGYKNCIAAGTSESTANLTVNGGTYTLTSTGKSGFSAQNVTVNDGTFTFSGTGTVSTSDFHKTHGISCDGDAVINGGKFTITAYNGKGVLGDTVKITGGTIEINSSGVSGYTSDSNKTGTYYDADGVKQTLQSIVFAAEGIEGTTSVTISGGTVKVTAEDDAMNVSNTGGAVIISGGSIYTYASRGDGIDSNGNIKISGGVLVTCAPTGSEDGLDCGDGSYSITITGGLIGSCSGSSNASKPSISGQKGFILGSSNSGMGGGMFSTGDSTSARFGGGPGGNGGGNTPGSKGGTGGNSDNTGGSSSSSYAGTTIVILDSDDEVVYAFTVPSASSSSGTSSGYANIIMTSPELETSESYTVYTGATVTGGTSFNGIYTALPSVSSSGTEASATSL